MATLASTQVTYGDQLDQPYPVSGLHVEHWRVASGGSAADTCAIPPKRGRYVVSVVGGPAYNNLGTLGTNTNVTLTLVGGTATIGSFDVQLFVAE